jgi:hypothetical protein
VVDEQLTAAVEQLRQPAGALNGLEAVVLLDPDPGQLAPLSRQLVTQPGVLLLAGEQLLAGGRPLLTRSDRATGHSRSPFRRMTSTRTVDTAQLQG